MENLRERLVNFSDEVGHSGQRISGVAGSAFRRPVRRERLGVTAQGAAFFHEGFDDALGNVGGNVALAAGDFFDDRTREKDLIGRGDEEKSFDFWSEVFVDESELEFVLEVADGAQPPDDDASADRAAEVDEQTVVSGDGDVRVLRQRKPQKLQPLLSREEGFFIGVDADGDDDAVEVAGGSRNEIDMTERRRVESAAVNGNS